MDVSRASHALKMKVEKARPRHLNRSARRGSLEVACEFGGFMKIFLIVLLVIFLNSILFAQTNQPSISEPTRQELSLERKSETQNQIVLLPTGKRKFRPKISLQRALKLAESYIEKEKIDISSFYLYQAKYILYGSKENRKPAWHLWWVNEDGTLGNYVEILVFIDTGSVGQLPSM